MKSPTTLLLLYALLVILASLAGGWLLMTARLTHARLQVAISFVAGLMLGMALLHFLPHAFFQVGSVDSVVKWTLTGFMAMFILQRFFDYHHHDVTEAGNAICEHGHTHDHDHPVHEEQRAFTIIGRDSHQHAAPGPRKSLTWIGMLLGLTLHSLLDGLALGAAVAADTHTEGVLFGFGALLAIVLHKPFDAMAISTLMTSSGATRAAKHTLNAGFALSTPLGMLLFYLGASQFAESQAAVVGGALAFSAGTFLCIAASDLLPELQFHSHDRLKLSTALLAGIAVAILIGRVETSGHDHFHDSPQDGNHDHGQIEQLESPASSRA